MSHVSIVLYSVDLFDTFNGTQFLYQGFQTRVVVNHDGNVATEQPVVGIDIDGAQYQFFFFRDDAGNVVYNTDIVVIFEL